MLLRTLPTAPQTILFILRAHVLLLKIALLDLLLLQAALLLKIALLQLLLLQTALLPQTHLLQHELLLVPKQACSLLQTA
jgi:hypothetical protein